MSETLENYFTPTSKKETLSKQQEQILARVLEIIETNPALNQKLADSFRENAKNVLISIDNFDLISKLIDENSQKALSLIENTYQKDQDKEKALRESKDIIQKATILKLTWLKISLW